MTEILALDDEVMVTKWPKRFIDYWAGFFGYTDLLLVK